MSRSSLPLLSLLGLSIPAYAEPGASHFRLAPKDAPVELIELNDASFHVEIPEMESSSQKICQRERTSVSGDLVMLRGDWKRRDLRVPDRGGAVAKIEFFGPDGKRINDPISRVVRPAVQGSHDWEDIDALVRVPASAQTARACVGINGVSGGSIEVRDLGIEAMAEGPGEGPNILIILIDTLRSDALGAYGQPLPLSPAIDAFAADSIVYEKAWTQYTWTVPSVISLFLSQYGRTHGWDSSAKRVNDGDFTEMPLEVPTLAELLKEQGYLTESHRANSLTRHAIGLSRGFVVYDAAAHSPRRDFDILSMASTDIERWDSDGQPNFLYLHFMGPHTPLWPSAEGQAAAGVRLDIPTGGITGKDQAEGESLEAYHARFRDAYLASILDIDRHIGSLLDLLEREGHADNTLVFLTSDHGELLGEHGLISHGNYVYEPLTSVPLMVRAPGVDAQRVQSRVGEVIDIAPTILDYLELESEIPESWQGRSLFDTTSSPLPAVSERFGLRATTVDGRYKIIEDRATHALEMAVDLQEDPVEEVPLLSTDAEVVELIEASREWLEATPVADETKSPSVQVDTEERESTQEALRALGYVE
jgi:iduronate 2-sulfatase